MTHLMGEAEFWIGKSMKEAHKNIDITDEIFDQLLVIV